jgi:hypothetical protein
MLTAGRRRARRTRLVVLSKSDLDPDPAARVPKSARRCPAGPTVLPISVVDGTGLDAVAAMLGPGVTGVLLGASGVGKTSLLNRLAGGDRATAPIREADDRGPPHDHLARARAAGRRRRRDRHARPQAPAHLGAGRGPLGRVRRRRDDRRDLPLLRLQARGRAGLRRSPRRSSTGASRTSASARSSSCAASRRGPTRAATTGCSASARRRGGGSSASCGGC